MDMLTEFKANQEQGPVSEEPKGTAELARAVRVDVRLAGRGLLPPSMHIYFCAEHPLVYREWRQSSTITVSKLEQWAVLA
jgi:hypothetical protein